MMAKNVYMNMKKVNCVMAALAAFFSFCCQPAYAAETVTGPAAKQIMAADTETQEKLKTEIGDDYISDESGHIVSGATGETYYLFDGETYFTDGLADDGYFYEDGKQVNTFTYIADKYYSDYKKAASYTYLEYDSLDEMNLFIQYLQYSEGCQQGHYMTYWVYDNSTKIRIQKSVIQEAIGSLSDTYWEKIRELASEISQDQSTKEKVYWTDILVSRLLEFDSDAIETDIDTAISEGRGVCYHYAKIEHDILSVLGIQSEYMHGVFGDTSNVTTTHGWLRVWDDENGQWLYKDPMMERRYVVGSNLYWNIDYQQYCENYTQMPVNTAKLGSGNTANMLSAGGNESGNN